MPRKAPRRLRRLCVPRPQPRSKAGTVVRFKRGLCGLREIVRQAKTINAMRVLAYCIMPNHWHLVIYPATGSQMSQFMRWLTGTHAQRWQAWNGTIGTGAVYQGRYKAIPVQTDGHFLSVCRYVERNPLRAGLVRRAEEWRWSSLWNRVKDSQSGLTDPWPVSEPGGWIDRVNGFDGQYELDRIRAAVAKGMPLGDPQWTAHAAGQLGLESRLRPRGRPKKAPDPFSLF